MLVDWMMAVLRFAAVASVCPRIVSRDDWGAKLPNKVTEMRAPVSTVVIHHTYLPAYCATAAECEQAMRWMQDFHQSKGWDDIGYSFAIGGEGRVYKGRGWNRVGAHAPPYNFDSIGITLIGDWREEAPPTAMLDAAQWLIKCGVQMGHIAPDYQLIGHLQAVANHTECPGTALMNVIKTWEHWTDAPAKPRAAVRAADEVHAADVVPVTPAPAPRPAPVLLVPVMVEGTYNPANPNAEKDAVEVRQLNKRSLWDRLVQIWQKEALRREALGAQHGSS